LWSSGQKWPSETAQFCHWRAPLGLAVWQGTLCLHTGQQVQ
jgi:hypothetical protein